MPAPAQLHLAPLLQLCALGAPSHGGARGALCRAATKPSDRAPEAGCAHTSLHAVYSHPSSGSCVFQTMAAKEAAAAADRVAELEAKHKRAMEEVSVGTGQE